MPRQKTRAFLNVLLASFFFSTMAVLVKLASTSFGAAEILFIRGLFSVIIMITGSWLVFKKLPIGNLNLLIVRALAGGLSVLFYFVAIVRIPLSSAVLLANSYPVFAVLLSFLLIKERPKWDSLLVLLVALSGMVLILNPKLEANDPGYFSAILSAFFAGIAVFSIRVLRRTDSSWVITMFQMVGAILVSVIWLPAGFVWPDPQGWLLLLAISLAGIAAQVTFTSPFKFVPTAEGALVAPTYAAMTVVFSILFFKEQVTLRFLCGAAMIFGGLIYLIFREELSLRKLPGEIS